MPKSKTNSKPKTAAKQKTSGACHPRLVHRLWHLAWIIWHESEMRSSERAMDHISCLKHAKKQLGHIEQIEATFPLKAEFILFDP